MQAEKLLPKPSCSITHHCSENVARIFSKCNSLMDRVEVKLYSIQTTAATTTRITIKWANKFYSGSPLSFIKHFKAGKEF